MKFIKEISRFIYRQSPNKRILIRLFIDAFLLAIAVATCSITFFGISFSQNILLLTLFLAIGLPFYLLTGQYESLTRYIGSSSLYKLAIRNLLLVLILLILGYILNLFTLSIKGWILVYLSITGSTGLGLFILRDLLLSYDFTSSRTKSIVAIYGAGSAGAQLLSSLRLSGNYKVLFFLDDQPLLWKRSLNGEKIHTPEILSKYRDKIDYVLLAIPSLKPSRRREIIQKLRKFNIPVLQIPSIVELTTGRANINNLRPISIEDLLGRDSVLPEPKLLKECVEGLSICVTGAGGSIGRELCRQIVKFKPNKLVLLEISEPCLYSIEQELLNLDNEKVEIIPILGSAANLNLMKRLFVNEKINIAFHAAAYKHVPLVESNPIEGIFNNVISTKVVCQAAKFAFLKKVILISTDKAVRPTNIMGVSKRLAELVVQSFAQEELLTNPSSNLRTIFAMVRFGNVLGSSGSVVPLFQKQIKQGGPITITHPDIIRYFMTINEAAQLVMQSSALAQGGEVFLLDMGEPVKIYDLACEMVKLSGLRVRGKDGDSNDIQIVTTGLRPGEKLYEELLIDSKAEKTKHNLIFKACEKNIDSKILWPYLEELENRLKEQDLKKVFLILQKLVPEWKIRN